MKYFKLEEHRDKDLKFIKILFILILLPHSLLILLYLYLKERNPI